MARKVNISLHTNEFTDFAKMLLAFVANLKEDVEAEFKGIPVLATLTSSENDIYESYRLGEALQELSKPNEARGMGPEILKTECPACSGTGLCKNRSMFSDARVCPDCRGTGECIECYTPFTGRKTVPEVKMVYAVFDKQELTGLGTPITYEQFLAGQLPS